MRETKLASGTVCLCVCGGKQEEEEEEGGRGREGGVGGAIRDHDGKSEGKENVCIRVTTPVSAPSTRHATSFRERTAVREKGMWKLHSE